MHGTHCMQIVLKSRFQFPHCVMKKCFVSKGYYNIQTYLPFWFKMQLKLPGFGVTRSRRLPFRYVSSARFAGVVLLR